ncbi:MAG TPA: hypothetical protein VIZ65_00495 [Cellvibrionaceae bacterium]
MSGTLLALSMVSLQLNFDDVKNEETQAMLILTSQRALLLIANNDDHVTEGWLKDPLFSLRLSGPNLLDVSASVEAFTNPVAGSKQLIFNAVKSAFGENADERLKHKKFSDKIGHIKLGTPDPLKTILADRTVTTILVTGKKGDLKTVNSVVHAEQKLVAALEEIEAALNGAVQSVWVAGCKRACNLCYDKLSKFRESKKSSYDFEFESPQLTACQGSQRTVRYD